MGLFKRGKVYWCSYTDPSGERQRISTGIKSRSKAEEFWAHLKLSLTVGDYTPADARARIPKCPTFEKIVESFVEDRTKRGKREDSYKKLADWAKAFEGRKVQSITLDEIETQAAKWRDDRKWKPATFNNCINQISGVLTHCYRKGWIDRHPMKGRAERMDMNNERERYPFPHEIEAMRRTARALARLRGEPVDWLANIILGAAFSGLRKGAFCDLRVRDVTKDEHGSLYLFVGKDKNGKPIEKRLTGELEAIVQDRIDSALPMAFLFPGPRETSAYRAVDAPLRFVVERIGKRHPDWGLRWGVADGGVTFHSFRHAMASLALNAGVPEDVVQKMGNWKTPSMMKRYAKRANSQIRDAEDKLAEILCHNTSQSAPKGGANRDRHSA